MNWIDGRWIPGTGPQFTSADPTTGEPIWQARAASPVDVGSAVAAARAAFPAWARLGFEEREARLEAFGRELSAAREDLAALISREAGKPLWEARTEVDAMVAKIGLSRRAYGDRCRSEPLELGGSRAAVLFRPHGALAVLGPFNMPGHLPNGHIVPALLAGNTVVFKPSELTPSVGEATVKLWARAGLPRGVLNLVQGGAETGRVLSEEPGIDGLLFTGSYETGCALHRAFAGRPEKMLALEMGGNNPLVVWEPKDLEAAALQTVLSAFITAGQRCTCARRLIVPAGEQGEGFLRVLLRRAAAVRVGTPTERPEPFFGSVISPAAAEQLLEAQEDLARRGGRILLEMRRVGQALLTPGIIEVSDVAERPDRELFGPLLQVIRVADFAAALEEANRTAYGLCAGLLSDEPALQERFLQEVRAGVVHWNRPTTGASGRLPFGGVGRSGNHRPSGYFTVDYCAYPVAAQGTDTLGSPEGPPGL
jgi:succinylglutamic semialdehyde dehydrogenase